MLDNMFLWRYNMLKLFEWVEYMYIKSLLTRLIKLITYIKDSKINTSLICFCAPYKNGE